MVDTDTFEYMNGEIFTQFTGQMIDLSTQLVQDTNNNYTPVEMNILTKFKGEKGGIVRHGGSEYDIARVTQQIEEPEATQVTEDPEAKKPKKPKKKVYYELLCVRRS